MVKEFNFINFFRAIAAFWVIMDHCLIWGDYHGIVIPKSKIAVDLFMMISGYLMAANASARSHFEPLTSLKSWLRFWLRRFFRLAPAYYISLALVIMTSRYFLMGYHQLQSLNPERWPVGGIYDPMRIEYSFTNVMLHLSFLFGLHPQFSFSTFLPDWSLSLEMQFYFIFPALLFVMHRFGFLKIALGIGVPVFVLGFFIGKSVQFYEPSFLLFKLNYFIAGILLYQVFRVTLSKRQFLFFVASALCLTSLDLLRYRVQFVVPPLLWLAMFTLGWWESKSKTPTWILSIVNSRVVRFGSDASYGAYLFHGFFISSFGLLVFKNNVSILPYPQERFFIMIFFVATSAYITAYFVHRFIEMPGIRLGKYVLQKFLPIDVQSSQRGIKGQEISSLTRPALPLDL